MIVRRIAAAVFVLAATVLAMPVAAEAGPIGSNCKSVWIILFQSRADTCDTVIGLENQANDEVQRQEERTPCEVVVVVSVDGTGSGGFANLIANASCGEPVKMSLRAMLSRVQGTPSGPSDAADEVSCMLPCDSVGFGIGPLYATGDIVCYAGDASGTFGYPGTPSQMKDFDYDCHP